MQGSVTSFSLSCSFFGHKPVGNMPYDNSAARKLHRHLKLKLSMSETLMYLSSPLLWQPSEHWCEPWKGGMKWDSHYCHLAFMLKRQKESSGLFQHSPGQHLRMRNSINRLLLSKPPYGSQRECNWHLAGGTLPSKSGSIVLVTLANEGQ